MKQHGIFENKQKNVNLYLFYFLSICVCMGRYISLISTFFCCVLNAYTPLNYYNYGFYTAAFSIILIAVSQVNSINTASLRTRYIN